MKMAVWILTLAAVAAGQTTGKGKGKAPPAAKAVIPQCQIWYIPQHWFPPVMYWKQVGIDHPNKKDASIVAPRFELVHPAQPEAWTIIGNSFCDFQKNPPGLPGGGPPPKVGLMVVNPQLASLQIPQAKP